MNIHKMKFGTRYLILCCLFLLPVVLVGQENASDSIPIPVGIGVRKAVYTDTLTTHNKYYNWAWGKHYRELYYQPISARTVSLNSLFGGLSPVIQLPKLHAVISADNNKQLYLVKPLGGSSTFLESKFFQNVYEYKDFKGTFLDDFIKEAYTVIHPYIFVATERLAKSAGVGNASPHIYYVAEGNVSDTISDGSDFKNKLIGVYQLPDIVEEGVINDTDSLLNILHGDNTLKIDQDKYIKARLFDMLVGDWNKVSENWYWIPEKQGDITMFTPQTLDRSHSFTKVDGVFFKELLNMLGVGFITDYAAELKNVKKFNKLSYPLDVAVTQASTADDWQRQANELKSRITDEAIENAFAGLPPEMQNEDAKRLMRDLKQRRQNLGFIAAEYYKETQETPVVTGSDKGERFVVTQDADRNLRISIYDKQTGRMTFDKLYSRKFTKEIWLYGLGGYDDFEIDKNKMNIALLVIGGKGTNEYRVEEGKNVSIYEYKSEKERLKSVEHANVIIPNDEEALDYDYQKIKYSTVSFTPIGIYDSDLGLNIGTSVAYTLYGFKRAPFTRRHQISYDYTNGFTYQGIFPSFDHKKSLHIAAYLGSPAYFSNFFGFGNDTDGHKDENKKYNRVNISKYMLTPALYYNITKEQTVNTFASFEVYKVKNPDGRDRFINTVYGDDDQIFDANFFMNLGATYELNKKMPGFVSSLSLSATGGWNFDIADIGRNYAYAKAQVGIDLRITDRITFATQVKGTTLSSDKYEFYQAATTELRGFRNNRFIGKHSLYQYSDIRLDMGKIQNPLAPLNYGVFAGIDHGRVWYDGDSSDKWHSSYGGGFWLTVLRKFTGKFSYFGSSDGSRFMFQLGLGF